MEQQQNMKTIIQILGIILHCRGSSADIRWERRSLVGEHVTLRCLFGSQSKVVEKSALTVEWNVVDKNTRKSIVYTFDGRAHENTDGYVVDELGLLQNNASLQLRNVTLRDEGLYTCRIITPMVHIETTSLEVLAQPSVSLPEKAAMTEGEEKSLQCDITGFYPKEVAVKWLIKRGSSMVFTDARNHSRVCTESPVQNQNGTYSTRSGITLHSFTVKDGEIHVICQVEHLSYTQPYSTTATLTVHAPSQLPYSAVTLVAVTSVISLLLVTCVTAGSLLLYRYFCKGTYQQEQTARCLM
ncbi:Natural cytotoxicity triggering receptor 3 ligand 1 B7 -like protein 6 [Channa argus]|uniref:Natural cytotoxicity triggering receptor 3 ligand 1 B7-like protein 6 n=1 Tax=Channa argus TaxID=215402 RepID=A0A6G1PGE9_CHAAH|nr:Natural cytotoxicity triggering receptor 3 ligand 1 B7 -like protein 6 [Channa argus]